jgi:peptidoglycan/LPS O-acetylase OafA/YrhL
VTHRPELDGLRGLAIALVLMAHADIPFHGFGGGLVGVTLFFVLSGYLITGLLKTELARTGRIDLRNFYLRRAVRLGPALLLVAAFVASIGLVGGWHGPWIPGEIATFSYSTNWADLAGVPTGAMGHTWSLSIEEQFYALWPMVLLALPNRWIALAGAMIGTALYAMPMQGAYFSTITNGGALLAGCAIALWNVRLPRSVVGVGLGLVFVACLKGSQPMAVIAGVTIIASGSLALAPVAPFGRRAYGLYLWSWPLARLLGSVGLLVTLAAAELSYRHVEQPILRRYHDRLRPRERSEAIEPTRRALRWRHLGWPSGP